MSDKPVKTLPLYSSAETLLPCPFCGWAARRTSSDIWEGEECVCCNNENCRAEVRDLWMVADCAELWNTRTPAS